MFLSKSALLYVKMHVAEVKFIKRSCNLAVEKSQKIHCPGEILRNCFLKNDPEKVGENGSKMNPKPGNFDYSVQVYNQNSFTDVILLISLDECSFGRSWHAPRKPLMNKIGVGTEKKRAPKVPPDPPAVLPFPPWR